MRRALHIRSVAEVELDYLNTSTSPVDLELRMREVDRGRFRSFQRNI